VSDRLRKQINIERGQLRRLLEVHRPLIHRCAIQEPDAIETSALAAMLHSFYTGVENIFKRIALECDGRLPATEAWHRTLLVSMTQGSAGRSPVISEGLRDSLRAYMDFRHVFRQAYAMELRWGKMSNLVAGCEDVLSRFDSEIEAFVQTLDRAT